jgi:hypothetical protein
MKLFKVSFGGGYNLAKYPSEVFIVASTLNEVELLAGEVEGRYIKTIETVSKQVLVDAHIKEQKEIAKKLELAKQSLKATEAVLESLGKK